MNRNLKKHGFVKHKVFSVNKDVNKKMASALNEESVEKKLKTVTNTQDSIQTLSLWIIHHKIHHAKIVELWMKVLKKSVQPAHRLTLLYLCNDVVQTCKKKKAYVYNATFKEYLREAAALVRDHTVKNKVERIFNIWEERNVFDSAFVKSLHNVLDGQLPKTQKPYKLLGEEEVNNSPISPLSTPRVEFESKEAVPEPHETDSMAEHDEEESARILAEFKPHEMIDQITAFRRMEVEIQLKVSQLSHLKIDISNLDAVKHLKDRAHGNDFSNQFEDSCTKLEDLVKRQTRHIEDQRAMIETLRLSETFYEEQYREAKIVANAYKNFGARINNMKKKLDELKRTFPEPESPVSSPDVNAPSPGATPPYVTSSGYGYNPAAPMNYGQGLQKKVWAYSETGAVGATSTMNELIPSPNTFQESPPLEAPSPEGSPPDLNLDGSDNVSLDSRLASFFDRNRSETSNPPVYTPQISRLSTSSSKTKLSGDDDGGTTPLDDEAPTTPVQDENLVSPPKRSTPPKKENPIDFLSRLISQTQKAPAKTGTPSFLDSLTMLTPFNKKSEAENQQQASAPQSWAAWKMQTNESSTSPSQPSSPLPYGPAVSLPSSSPLSYRPGSNLPTPTTPYPPTPTMVPPPIPMPVPPPVSLNVPPPPPPPFGLSSVIAASFSGPPPPVFQQTSPGQKENWPDLKPAPASDHPIPIRTAHNSVLKELVPAEDVDIKSGPPLTKESSSSSAIVPDAMEIVSDEDSAEDSSEKPGVKSSEAVGDAKTEFAQKLKQKTSQGMIKSHVFVPNPERPNLMTLTVSDDLDEEDMIDDDTVMEETPTWSDKSHKTSHKSRSRSRSRDKDRSHKHKKKKKYKRSHNSDDNSNFSDDEIESKGIATVGSVVKKIDASSSRHSRDGSKSEKYDYEDNRKYDDDRKYKYEDDRKYEDRKYEERKYDRYDDRAGYEGRDDYRPYKAYKGSKDIKDTVQAYTQAYRDAFFQQYTMGRLHFFPPGPPPMDPRRSAYGKF